MSTRVEEDSPGPVRKAAAIQAGIDAQRRRYLPRSEQLPWWEEFGDLLVRLVQPTGPRRA